MEPTPGDYNVPNKEGRYNWFWSKTPLALDWFGRVSIL